MNRRSLLASLAVTATVLPAGCLSSVRQSLDPTVKLGWFGVHNVDTDSHRFDLKVVRDGTRVHYSSHDVQGRAERTGSLNHGAVADCDWGSTPGDYAVGVRVDGGEWTETSATVREAECVAAVAEYRNNTEFSRYADGYALTISIEPNCTPGAYRRTCSFVTR